MTKSKKAKSNLSEWQLMLENLDAFQNLVIPVLKSQGYTRIRVFAVGSPRNFMVVVNVKKKGITGHKRFKWDIRDGSHQFWLDSFWRLGWDEQNHIVQGLDIKP